MSGKQSEFFGIDGNEANVADRVGANVYAHRVLIELDKLAKKKAVKFRVYLKNRPFDDFPHESEFWKYKVFGPSKLWTQWRLPLELFREMGGPQVFFTPGHYAPRFSPIPTVISIMDLAFLRFPKDFRSQDLKQLTSWTAYSVKKASRILAISKATKKDICRFYEVDSKKVAVTYPGYDKQRFDRQKVKPGMAKTKEVLKKYRLKDPYLVYVGTLQPRKNVARLISGFARIKSAFPNHKLVVVGKKGWLYDEMFVTTKKLNLEQEVVFTGFAPEEELPHLVAGAQAYVLPSLYEGFGIPVVEAMALGVPVVVSQVSSLSELAGKAGIYIKNPQSVKQISEALVKVLELTQGKRQKLIKQGLKQAEQFSWRKCGQQALTVLQQVAENKHS